MGILPSSGGKKQKRKRKNPCEQEERKGEQKFAGRLAKEGETKKNYLHS